MKAVIYNKKSLPSKLSYAELDKPTPLDQEVLIKIHAVSINAADYRSISLGVIPKKKIFGADISGIIESVGKNSTQFHVGDEVMGDLSDCGFGGFANYTTAPENALVLKPKNLSFESASALPLASVTALQGLRNLGKIRKGHNVLIVGSSGGVGTYAIQLAKYFEATVTAVCSTKNVAQAFSLKADYVIDYKTNDFSKTNASYDLILAVNGNYSLSTYKNLLAPHGICVVVGGSYSQIFKSILFGKLFSFGSKKICSLFAKPNSTDLAFISHLADSGAIYPVIESQVPFENLIEAVIKVGTGHTSGKVVVSMG